MEMKLLHSICLKFLLLSILITLSNGNCPGNVKPVTFNQAFGNQWGEIGISNNGNSVNLSLRNRTGSSGFNSRASYASGLFSANIKLPPQNYSAGIVVTFYLTNGDKYPDDQHDEIDFEFLGHINNQGWILQTNFYGNGSRDRGREEQYKLWFDPSKESHRYSIFWDRTRILYFIDDLLIREVQKVDKMGGDYPSKPMTLFATIWDGSGWATEGGRDKANFTYEPFVAQYSDFSLSRCWFNWKRDISYCGESGHHWMVCGKPIAKTLLDYHQFRNKFLTYSYCDDKRRYKSGMPECLVMPRAMGEAGTRESSPQQKFQKIENLNRRI